MKLRIVGESRMLHPEHPLTALPCLLCGHRLGGARIALLPPGKGRHRRMGGRWPIETALPVHEACMEGEA